MKRRVDDNVRTEGLEGGKEFALGLMDVNEKDLRIPGESKTLKRLKKPEEEEED